MIAPNNVVVSPDEAAEYNAFCGGLLNQLTATRLLPKLSDTIPRQQPS